MRRFCRTCEQWADLCDCDTEDEDIVTVPNGCICNPMNFNHKVPNICNQFTPAASGFYCDNCWHEESCHKGHP